MDVFNFLKAEAAGKTTLPALVDVFEKMCELPIENVSDADIMILFETGTYTFTGKPLFYFSLVRQYPDEEDEFYQLRLELLYEPSETTAPFSRTDWDIDLKENIFDHFRKSAEYIALKDEPIYKISVYLNQT